MHEAPFEFLARWNIGKQDLLSFAPEVGPNECLALVGSIVEGLANEESDIDMLYLGAGSLKNKIVMRVDTLNTLGVSHDAQGHEMNVEQILPADLEEIETHIGKALGIFRNLREGRGIFVENNPGRLRFLHRIKTSVPLTNPEVLHAWQQRLRVDELHKFVCLSRVQDLMNLREDIVGETEAGNIESAIWMSKTLYAPLLVGALLASVGETNTHTKWHYRLFRRHSAAIGERRVEEVLEFVNLPPAELQDNLIERLIGVTESALHDIYQRNRDVAKASMAWSLAVRYTNPATGRRWKRGNAAAGSPAG